MGNNGSKKGDDFHRILTEMKKDQSRRININPEKVANQTLRNTSPSWRTLSQRQNYLKDWKNSFLTRWHKRWLKYSS